MKIEGIFFGTMLDSEGVQGPPAAFSHATESCCPYSYSSIYLFRLTLITILSFPTTSTVSPASMGPASASASAAQYSPL